MHKSLGVYMFYDYDDQYVGGFELTCLSNFDVEKDTEQSL